jgi:hypothetical protein
MSSEDLIDAAQDQGDGVGADFDLAVAELAEHVFAGMSHFFEARQTKEPAGALDGVHHAEDVLQDAAVVRMALKPHQFLVQKTERLCGLGHEFHEQIVHVGSLLCAVI